MVMKALQRVLCLLVISLLFVANSWAMEIRGRSSTQFLWFDDFYNGRQAELAQYLRVAATGPLISTLAFARTGCVGVAKGRATYGALQVNDRRMGRCGSDTLLSRVVRTPRICETLFTFWMKSNIIILLYV